VTLMVAAPGGGDQVTVAEEVAEARGASLAGRDTLEDGVAAWGAAAWVALALGGAEETATAAAAALAAAVAVVVRDRAMAG